MTITCPVFFGLPCLIIPLTVYRPAQDEIVGGFLSMPCGRAGVYMMLSIREIKFRVPFLTLLYV